jgi:hypothetical protein
MPLGAGGEGAVVADGVTSEWYYSKLGAPPGQHVGPFSWEQLVSNARAGIITPDDLVWNPQLPQWLPAGQVPGLVPSATPFSAQSPARPSGNGRSKLVWLLPLIAVILVGVGWGLLLFLTRDNDEGKAANNVTTTGTVKPGGGTSPTEVAFVQNEGEVFLEPANGAGPESFAGDALVYDHAVPSPTSLPVLPTSSTLAGAPIQLASFAGGTPGLYGGSRNKLVADKAAQLKFLQENLDKAKAFCAALNSDPTLRWSGGTQVQPDQLAAFFAELTPLLLLHDTRVTNNGYRDGKPVPRQSVLQAGQLILVDAFGVPRARCECGNPLTPPRTVSAPTYTGTKWPSFDAAAVIIIEQAAAVIESFSVFDVDTGEMFARPAGSGGEKDVAPTTTTTSTTIKTGEPQEMFSVGNTGGVANGASPATFVIDQPWLITEIHTYHWNNAQGATPGTIGLRSADGTLYGPWQATGRDGQGGVPNAYWVIQPNYVIPAGEYTVIDSDPSTWAQNGGTGGVGMCWGGGVPQGMVPRE